MPVWRSVIIALLWLSPKDPAVSIHLSRSVVMVNTQTQALSCHVRPDTRNRLLDYGIVDFAEHSQRPIDGENGPITTGPVFYAHLPCHVTTAYCMVIRNDNTYDIARQTFEIAGCDE